MLLAGLILLFFNAFYVGDPSYKEIDEGISHKKFIPLVLDDLSQFETTGSNWQIVGKVYADTTQDQLLIAGPGTGILVNLQDEKNRQHIFTTFSHGDIELKMEVMMAKESNSGIYLQGRYEVQLYDSWDKKEPKYSHMGGIYQRTDPETNKGFEGSAPMANVCKPPGEWQQLRIIFKAPRFDENEKKTKNAIFKKVYLNGVLIQKNVEVSGPTRSSAYDDEKPTGPIMLQGNHGPVAFKNIRYKNLGKL